MRQSLNPANLFTLLRIVLAPFVIAAILLGEHGPALALFACAALTDGIDGFLARRFGWMTEAGAVLDPIADKILLSGVYLAMVAAATIPWWLVALIFGRDILILGRRGRCISFQRNTEIPPQPVG